MKGKIIVSDLLKAFMAGVFISIGGAVFLALAPENKIAAALFFTVGLFGVLFYGFNLYTGKIGYAVNEKPKYLLFLLLVLCGNLLGTLGAGLLVRLALPSAAEYGAAVSAAKLDLPLLSVFIKAVFCGILMFFAVDGYRRLEKGFLKAVAVVLGVAVFILAGFEHCVADMFYFTAGGAWSPYAALWILIAVAGNSVGSIIFALAVKIYEKFAKK